MVWPFRTAAAPAQPQNDDEVHPLDGSDERCIAYLENWRLAAQRRNSGMRNLWARGLHVFEGLRNEWEWDSVHQRLIFNQQLGSALRFSTNIVLPLVQDMVAQTIAQKPSWIANAGPDPQDRMADRAAQQFLDWGWQESRMDLQNLELLLWVFCCGFGSLKIEWDWEKGETLDIDVQELLARAGDLHEWEDEQIKDLLKGGGRMRLGGPSVRVVPPFNMLFDPTATRFLDAIKRERMELNVLTLDEVRANPHWRPQAYRVLPDRNAEDEGEVRTGVLGARDLHQGGSASEWDERRVTVREFRQPPMESNGYRGRLIQYVPGVMLFRGEISSSRAKRGFWDGLPYADFFWALRPGRLYPLGFVEQVDALQEEYDMTRSHQRQHRKLVAKPKVLTHSDARIGQGAFTDRMGQVVKWSGMHPPAYLHGAPFPEVDNHLNRIVADAQRLAISSETRGYQHQGLTAASALAIVEEKQRTQARPVQTAIDAGWARTGMIWLDLCHDNMTIDQQVRIVGASGKAELVELRREDLQNFDVWVEPGSSLPKSLYARQQFFLELFVKGGMLTPEGRPDARKLAKLLRAPELGDVYDEDLLDERTQEAENMALLRGEFVPRGPADNDLVHARAMYPIMKAPEFKSFPLPVQLAFVKHFEIHMSSYKQTLVEQQLLGAASGGGAPGGANPRGDPNKQQARPSEAKSSGNPTLDAARAEAQAAGDRQEVALDGGIGAG